MDKLKLVMKFRLKLLSIIIIGGISNIAYSKENNVIKGKVIGVYDGDTVTLLTKEFKTVKVRLAAIDAPERYQAFGYKSKLALSDCAFARNAVVELTGTSSFERPVGRLLVQNVDCNYRQIKLGMAWHSKKYQYLQTEKHRNMYAEAHKQAKYGKEGLWLDKNPIPPWKFRRH